MSASTAPWTPEQLDRIGGCGEIGIAPRRRDGSLRSFTTIWVVRVDDQLYVRSWNGPDGSWFGAASSGHGGRIRAGGDTFDVAFAPAEHDRAAVDAAYRDKYGASRYTDAMVADGPAATTLVLTPA